MSVIARTGDAGAVEMRWGCTMTDDVKDIADFYDQDPQGERVRLELHQLEHDLTWRYLERYLPKKGSVLEVGAATGRYSFELARRGHAVTAVGLSAAVIRECERQVEKEGFQAYVRCVVADARDLSSVSETQFDAVLMFGPLYHLVELSDRKGRVAGSRRSRATGRGLDVGLSESIRGDRRPAEERSWVDRRSGSCEIVDGERPAPG